MASADFDAVLELENLHDDLGRIETYTFAAVEALDRLRPANGRAARHAARRLDNLVMLVAGEVASALENADRVMERLRKHLRARAA